MTFDEVIAFGDIVLVPFPFTDQTASRRRPAVAVSGPDYHARHPDLIWMPVTSQMRSDARQDDVVVMHWREAGLLKPSAVKPVVATVERSLVIRKLGNLAQVDRDDLAAMPHSRQGAGPATGTGR